MQFPELDVHVNIYRIKFIHCATTMQVKSDPEMTDRRAAGYSNTANVGTRYNVCDV